MITLTTILGLAFILFFIIIEGRFRIGTDSKKFLPVDPKKDQGTSYSIATSWSIMFLIILSTFLLNAKHLGTLFACVTVYVAIFGLLLSASGIAIRMVANIHLGEFYTRTLFIKKKHRIVNTGIYSKIRHPGYLGQTMMWIGASIATCNIFAIILVTVISCGTYYNRYKKEEQMLFTKFGNDYIEYMIKTPVIPFILK